MRDAQLHCGWADISKSDASDTFATQGCNCVVSAKVISSKQMFYLNTRHLL